MVSIYQNMGQERDNDQLTEVSRVATVGLGGDPTGGLL